jgi:hypothetical protein
MLLSSESIFQLFHTIITNNLAFDLLCVVLTISSTRSITELKALTLLACAALCFSSEVSADETSEIHAVIHKLTTGVDQQDKALLLEAFREDAALFATNPAGDGLIAVAAGAFADMHESGRFGGQQREVVIESVDITEGLVAAAKVVASTEQVHYIYYLGLTKVDGTWLVQTFLQRSRQVDSD